MRIVFTGGGTGGHVFPNIAIIDEIRDAESTEKCAAACSSGSGEGRLQASVFYIGGKNSIEKNIAEDAGILFYGISAGKFRRYFDVKNFTDFFKALLGIFQSLKILKKEKPDLLFAKGGYVSVPVVLAAAILRIPVWLHESDVSPGLSTKICSRFTSKIFLSFEESKKFFRGKKTETVGNPIRKAILEGSRARGLKLTGFAGDKPILMIMGGSTGAQSLNEIIYEILPDLLHEAEVIHVTGVQKTGAQYAPKSPQTGARHRGYKQFDFLNEELADCYAVADAVVSRAGSGAIFEILALRKPMLLVPLPASASRGDQIENAKVFTDKMFALSADQQTIKPFQFLGIIKKLIHNNLLRQKMIERQRQAGLENAAAKIACELRLCPIYCARQSKQH